MLDELFFRLLLNRDVLTVLIKAVGVDAQGNEQSGIFDANLKRNDGLARDDAKAD